MTLNAGFFTAIDFGDQPKTAGQALLESVSHYFYLGGKKAYIIRPGQAILCEDSASRTAVKVISYCFLIFPLIALIFNAILRPCYHFDPFDTKKQLEEGIDISVDQVREALTSPSKTALGIHHVYSIESQPDYIFKAGAKSERFSNMVKAQETLLAHRLDRLIVPHAKIFNVDGTNVIVEQRLPVPLGQHYRAQEDLYHRLPRGTGAEIAQQLAVFTAITGFDDVSWRNIPLFEEKDATKVGLVDLEDMGSSNHGLRNLIFSLGSEEQIDAALAVARQYGFSIDRDKGIRMDQLRWYDHLMEYFRRNEILENPRKPVIVPDLAALGLDLHETATSYRGKMYTMEQAITEVLKEINRQIAIADESASTRGKRNFYIPTSYLPLSAFAQFESNNERWLKLIIDALVKQGAIFALCEVNGHGYRIQA